MSTTPVSRPSHSQNPCICHRPSPHIGPPSSGLATTSVTWPGMEKRPARPTSGSFGGGSSGGAQLVPSQTSVPSKVVHNAELRSMRACRHIRSRIVCLQCVCGALLASRSAKCSLGWWCLCLLWLWARARICGGGKYAARSLAGFSLDAGAVVAAGSRGESAA